LGSYVYYTIRAVEYNSWYSYMVFTYGVKGAHCYWAMYAICNGRYYVILQCRRANTSQQLTNLVQGKHTTCKKK